MMTKNWTLKRALDLVTRHRPEAIPNAGYLAQLLQLEEELFGKQTVKGKKTKPEPRMCPECGERVGLSMHSLRYHLRAKHPQCSATLDLPSAGSQQSPSSSTTSPMTSPTSAVGGRMPLSA